jgi:hypothetical protein
MLRTQIQLTDEQHRLLRSAARREGVSVSEVVRRCVARFFEAEEDRQALYARASSLVGKLDDPQAATDLSDRHDDYLDRAYG